MEEFPKNDTEQDESFEDFLNRASLENRGAQALTNYKESKQKNKDGENERLHTIEVTDDYRKLAIEVGSKLYNRSNIYLTNNSSFEEMEKATGLSELMKAGLRLIIEDGGSMASEFENDVDEIIEAIIDNNASDEAKEKLAQFREYSYYNGGVSLQGLATIHDKWVNNNEEYFFEILERPDVFTNKISIFLPFVTIGHERAKVYDDIISCISGPSFGQTDDDDEEFYEAFEEMEYSNVVDNLSLDKPYYDNSHDGDYPFYYKRPIELIFRGYSKYLSENPTDFYPALPKKVADRIRGDEQLAQMMIYDCTFGENSIWAPEARKKGFFELINSK